MQLEAIACLIKAPVMIEVCMLTSLLTLMHGFLHKGGKTNKQYLSI